LCVRESERERGRGGGRGGIRERGRQGRGWREGGRQSECHFTLDRNQNKHFASRSAHLSASTLEQHTISNVTQHVWL
jgi:hypothetical protein